MKGRVTGKERDTCERHKWMGKVVPPQELSGLQFYNQRWLKPPYSSFLSRHHTSIISSSSLLCGGIFLSLYGQARTVIALWKKYFQVSVQWESFILKSHLPISDYFLCTQTLFWESLTWWHHWADRSPYFLLLFYCFGCMLQRTCLGAKEHV